MLELICEFISTSFLLNHLCPLFMVFLQSPGLADYNDLEPLNIKPNALHLSTSPQEPVGLIPGPALPQARIVPPQEPPTQAVLGGFRFPSLPEHLECPSPDLEFQRHLSDPGLPGS